MVKKPTVAAPREPQIFVLDSSALIAYMKLLQPAASPPTLTDTSTNTSRYHQRILARWNALNRDPQYQPTEPEFSLPIRIPDYVIYELTGLLPNTIPFSKQRFAAIEAEFAPKLEAAAGNEHERLLEEKALRYQQQIDILVDASIRLDRRGNGKYGKDSISDRRDQLVHLFTLFAYHPDIISATKVGREFCQSAKAESAVLVGVGSTQATLKSPTDYAKEIETIKATYNADAHLAHYTLSFEDMHDMLGVDFKIDNLRIHWGHMYFMGLVDEDTYKSALRSDGGSKLANEQGYDSNRRFVTYGNFDGKVTRTSRNLQAVTQHVQRESSRSGLKPDELRRKNLLFGELKHALGDKAFTMPDGENGPRYITLEEALGPAKINLDNLIFSGVLPGKSIKIKHKSEMNDAAQSDVASLCVMAEALGYACLSVHGDAKDPYGALRNSLKRQGFFERSVTIEDLLHIEKAFSAHKVHCPHLETILKKLPDTLAMKPKKIIPTSAAEHPANHAPLERIFTDAAISGEMRSSEFLTLAIKLNPTALKVDQHPQLRLEKPGMVIHFKVQGIANPNSVQARELADAIIANSVMIEFNGNPISTRYGAPRPAPHGFGKEEKLSDMLRDARHERSSGNSNYQGTKVLEGLLVDGFVKNAAAQLTKAPVIFTELYGKEAGEATLFQMIKDFETRHERRFNRLGESEQLSPAPSAFASNHRNRRIFRRNLGEVSVNEVAQQALETHPDAHVWVIGNDQDIISFGQHTWIDQQQRGAVETGKQKTAVEIGKKGNDAGTMLHPRVVKQHSRMLRHLPMIQEQLEAGTGNPRCHNVPTRDFLNYLCKRNELPPLNGRSEDFTHKFLKASDPFQKQFGTERN